MFTLSGVYTGSMLQQKMWLRKFLDYELMSNSGESFSAWVLPKIIILTQWNVRNRNHDVLLEIADSFDDVHLWLI